jgi:hypothetical protein
MSQTVAAVLLRVGLVACGPFLLLVLVVGGGELIGAPEQLAAILPFVTIAVTAAVVVRLRPRIDRLVERRTHYREVTAYSALAEAAQRLQAGSLEQALPGLARVLADGTGATRAVVWLVVDEHLVAAAAYPGSEHDLMLAFGEATAVPDTAENLALLLARPDASHVVPILEGHSLRAALAIHKPDSPITPADRTLIEDVANGAALLLRSVAQNAELAERVRRADELADQLHASRRRLTRAREVEQRRLLGELSRTTTVGLAAVRSLVTAADRALDQPPAEEGADPATVAVDPAGLALVQARTELDELLGRFRTIVRGVYPAVLRDQGPAVALEELAADLPRRIRLTVGVEGRLPWEIESGMYYAVAAILNLLAAQPASRDLGVHLGLGHGRLQVRVEDPCPVLDAAQLRTALIDDAERLIALGGGLDATDGDGARAGPVGALRVLAWLPDHLEPLLDGVIAAPTSAASATVGSLW